MEAMGTSEIIGICLRAKSSTACPGILIMRLRKGLWGEQSPSVGPDVGDGGLSRGVGAIVGFKDRVARKPKDFWGSRGDGEVGDSMSEASLPTVADGNEKGSERVGAEEEGEMR